MTARRLAALAMSVAIAGAIGAVPASAAEGGTPETFQGSATGTALDLNLFGNPLTLGFTKVSGDSTVKAAAEGAGQLLDDSTTTTASVTSGQQENPDRQCSPLVLPDEVPGLDASVACADVSAKALGGLPNATSKASVVSLGLSGDEILDAIGLKEPLGEGAETLFDELKPLFEQLEGTELEDAPDTLLGLLQSVLNTDTLSVELGTSSSDIASTATSVTSTASAAGAVVKVLPTGAVGGTPILTIEVGAAEATASRDRAANKNEASFDPALVRVTLDEHLASVLQLPENTIEVAPGQDQCLLEGTPLESCIKVAAGSTSENDDGSVSAVADGVELHLLKGIPEPGEDAGVLLRLAHAEAAVGGAPATTVLDTPTTVRTPAPPAPPEELPRTGGPGPFVPFAGAGLLGLAVVLRRLAGRRA